MQIPKVKTVVNAVEVAYFCIKLLSTLCAKLKQKGFDHGSKCPLK